MVRASITKIILVSTFLVIWSAPVWAIFPQTQDDFVVLRDSLLQKSETSEDWADSVSPILVAPPQHLWQESKDDFSSLTMSLLTEVWSKSGQLIPCAECDQTRTRVSTDHQIQMSSGPLSSSELINLLAHSRYASAKSVLYVRETPQGIEVRLIRISDGSILYHRLADSTQQLEQAKPRLHLVDEMERRKRGEALAYTFLELGFFPQPMAHVSFLEQWGSANQHMTGITISIVGPVASLGPTYRYFFKGMPKVQMGASILFPVQNAVKVPNSGDSSSFAVFAGTIQYAFSPTFGFFGGINSQGSLSCGFSFYNPIWFPFML